jgi:hypothetical protein
MLGELILVLVVPTKRTFLRDAGMEFAHIIKKLGNVCSRSAIAAGLAVYEQNENEDSYRNG